MLCGCRLKLGRDQTKPSWVQELQSESDSVHVASGLQQVSRIASTTDSVQYFLKRRLEMRL
jgi:hypothetical protein